MIHKRFNATGRFERLGQKFARHGKGFGIRPRNHSTSVLLDSCFSGGSSIPHGEAILSSGAIFLSSFSIPCLYEASQLPGRLCLDAGNSPGYLDRKPFFGMYRIFVSSFVTCRLRFDHVSVDPGVRLHPGGSWEHTSDFHDVRARRFPQRGRFLGRFALILGRDVDLGKRVRLTAGRQG